MISTPGDDRGPGVMYRNHLAALAQQDSEISVANLTQEIWESDELLSNFDVAWGYVRFNPHLLPRLRSLRVPVIGGPNIVMERADAGIIDEYENWYLTQQSVDMNLNVANYYRNHVKKFVKNNMRCEVLEGAYDIKTIHQYPRHKKSVDVLLYQKIRVNDDEQSAKKRLRLIDDGLQKLGLTTRIIIYGNHTRDEYFKLCSMSKIVVWLSIEDYASLAQIEAHLFGACVVGTPYNFTIPVLDESVCMNSQYMKNWIEWKHPEIVANDFINTVQRVLAIKSLEDIITERSTTRHGFKRYRSEITRLIESLK